MASIRINRTIEIGPDKIANYVTNYYHNLFTKSPATKDNGMINEVIPHLINNNNNNMLTLTLSHDAIKVVPFNLNKDSSSGLHGFGGFLFKEYQSIISLDVCKFFIEFFHNNWILPNMNSNKCGTHSQNQKYWHLEPL